MNNFKDFFSEKVGKTISTGNFHRIDIKGSKDSGAVTPY